MKDLINNILFYIDLYKKLNSPVYREGTTAKINTWKKIIE